MDDGLQDRRDRGDRAPASVRRLGRLWPRRRRVACDDVATKTPRRPSPGGAASDRSVGETRIRL